MSDRSKETRFVYCSKCGHSAAHTRLSIGDDNCRRTLVPITSDEWLEMARSGKLKLTEPGYRVLRALEAQEGRDA